MSDVPAGWTVEPAIPQGWTVESADPLVRAKAALDAQDARLAASVPPPEPVVDPWGVGAIGHGLQSGLSLGWAPKIDAAVYAGLTGLHSDKSFSERYQEQLAKNRAEGEALKEAHPKTHFAADLVGSAPMMLEGAVGPIANAALSGAARTAGESENVLGEQGTNLRGAAETVGGAATGAATAYLLPKVFGRLARGRGVAADEASKDLVTFGTQTARNKLENAMAPVASMTGGELAPGETATILRDIGATRPTQRGVLKGIQQAKEDLGAQFGGLIKRADDIHTGVPLTSAQAHLDEALAENQANDSMSKVVDNVMGRLGKAQKDGVVSHAGLQDVLENMNRTAKRIYARSPNTWSEHDAAFISGYRALRATQSEGLEAALGQNANDLRKYMAMTYGLEPVAQKAVNRFEGNDKVGLLGELKKSQGKTGIGHGILATATGSPAIGVPMILKGALDVARGQMGKSTSPFRKYLSTNVNLALQKPLLGLSQSQLAQLAGAKLAAERGGGLGSDIYDWLAPEEQAPPANISNPNEVARALPRSMKGKP